MPPSVLLERGAPVLREPTVTELRLLLIGSGAFAVPSFAALANDAEVRIVSVITAPARAAGRGGALTPTPVGRWAAERGLPLREVAKIRDPESVASLLALECDGVLLADFGQIIPRGLLTQLPRGIVNLHPSLLPRYRGASPIPAAILAGDVLTGVTTILMDEGVDSGPVLAVQPCPVAPDDTSISLEVRLAALAAEGIAATMRAWIGGSLTPVAQATVGVTATTRMKREDGQISALTPCDEAHRRWRAYQPWPGAWFEAPGGVGRVLLVECGVPRPDRGQAPGSLILDGDDLLLALPGGLLPLTSVRPAGGATMSGGAFARGRQELLAAHARISR